MACSNDETNFSDFESKVVYFPAQYPLRTLSLGNNDYFDNSLDNELRFNIGIILSGAYENKSDYIVTYEMDDSLTLNVFTQDGDTIKPMPNEYYKIKPTGGQVTIPSGSRRGLIEVQLDSSFLYDAFATGARYVVPLKILTSTTDSIATGAKSSSVEGAPNRNKTADWNIPPMDYVLFGVKFINPYHGMYLHRGAHYTIDLVGDTVATNIYRSQYVVEDRLVNLYTRSLSQTTIQGYSNISTSETDQILLTASGNDNFTVSSAAGADYTFTGTGKYVTGGDEWGGKSRNVIHLQYTYNDGVNNNNVYDTLVLRDRQLKYEDFSVNQTFLP